MRLACSQPQPLKGDYATLQGIWIVIRNEERGTVKSERHGLHFTFEEDELDFVGVKMHYALDEKSTPKRIDLSVDKYRFEGIYKIEDDLLTLVTAPDSEPRPTQFESSKDAGTVLTVVQKRR